MDVVLLGTGSPLPDPNRAGPATLVRAGGLTLLVDAGRGVLQRAAACGVGAAQLGAVLLTHLHSDHLTDLGDVLTSQWVTTFAPTPLRVFGPARVAEVIDGTLAALAPDIDYRLAHHEDLTWRPVVEVAEIGDGLVLEEQGVRVTAALTEHAPASPSLAYRVEHEGRSVVVAGDTMPCADLFALTEGVDVYVQTAIRADLLRAVPLQRLQDVCDYHSSVEDAARTAARCGVRTLVLTHLVPAPAPGAEAEWQERAAAHFDGEIVVGADLLTVTV